MKVLAIETSCDETSIAIVDSDYNVLAHIINSQIDTFKNFGGVVPELSSRLHEQNLSYIYKEVFEESNLTIDDIDYIAVTIGPGLVGSLLCGVNFAKTLAYIYNKKIICVNHMKGHISSVLIEHKVKYPYLSLIVSGGHTEIVLVKDVNDFELIGETLDDACGECFDKVARLLNIRYPGGVEIDKLSQKGKVTYDLPFAKDDESYDFSYSGLKSACFNMINTMKMKNIDINKEDFAASFTYSAIEILIKKLKKASKVYNINSVSIVGGVSANSYLQKRIKEEFDTYYIPSLIYCTDNAAMIGAQAINTINEAVNYNNVDANIHIDIND